MSMSARILIVEDEWLQCTHVADLARSIGFEPTCALNDADAYAELRANGSTLAALVVDVNLGQGTTGFDVARFARKLNLGLPVLYLTGSPASVASFGVEGGRFLGKPFRDPALVEMLTEALSASC